MKEKKKWIKIHTYEKSSHYWIIWLSSIMLFCFAGFGLGQSLSVNWWVMSRQILRLFRHATRNCCDLTTNPSTAPQPHILHSRRLQQLTFNNVLNKSAPLVLSRHKSNQAGKKKGGNKTKSNLNTIIDRLGDDDDDDDIDDAIKYVPLEIQL